MVQMLPNGSRAADLASLCKQMGNSPSSCNEPFYALLRGNSHAPEWDVHGAVWVFRRTFLKLSYVVVLIMHQNEMNVNLLGK